MEKEFEELVDYLETAYCDISITINGMVPHIEGHMNDQGAIMAAIGIIKFIEHRNKSGFEEIVSILNDLNYLMNYKVVDREKT